MAPRNDQDRQRDPARQGNVEERGAAGDGQPSSDFGSPASGGFGGYGGGNESHAEGLSGAERRTAGGNGGASGSPGPRELRGTELEGSSGMGSARRTMSGEDSENPGAGNAGSSDPRAGSPGSDASGSGGQMPG